MKTVIIALILTILLTAPAWARNGYGPLINGKDWRQIVQQYEQDRQIERQVQEQARALREVKEQQEYNENWRY